MRLHRKYANRNRRHKNTMWNIQEELQKQIHTVKNFSDDIHMEFGLEKCAKIVFKRGKPVHSQNLVIDTNREIQALEQKKLTSTSRLRKVKAYNINK